MNWNIYTHEPYEMNIFIWFEIGDGGAFCVMLICIAFLCAMSHTIFNYCVIAVHSLKSFTQRCGMFNGKTFSEEEGEVRERERMERKRRCR